jgi:hypothetical protein
MAINYIVIAAASKSNADEKTIKVSRFSDRLKREFPAYWDRRSHSPVAAHIVADASRSQDQSR